MVLDCEYDEIIPADNGNLKKEGENLKWDYNSLNRPMFITRKGNSWGAVTDPYSVVPALYDLKSFTRTEQYDDERPMRTPYLIRRVNSWLVAVERGDTLLLVNDYRGNDMPFTNHRPGEIPPFEEWEIADFEGEYSPTKMLVFDAPDNMAAYNALRHHFIPHKGSTYDIKPFHTFTSDTLSTYILSGDYGSKLYNADLGKENCPRLPKPPGKQAPPVSSTIRATRDSMTRHRDLHSHVSMIQLCRSPRLSTAFPMSSAGFF